MDSKVDIEVKIEQVVNDLKELREAKGITTAKLEELTGIAQPNITRMETGGSKPNLRTIVAIADALGADIKVVERKQTK